MLLNRNREDGNSEYASEATIYLSGDGKQKYCIEALTGKNGYVIRAVLKDGRPQSGLSRALKENFFVDSEFVYSGVICEKVKGNVRARY